MGEIHLSGEGQLNPATEHLLAGEQTIYAQEWALDRVCEVAFNLAPTFNAAQVERAAYRIISYVWCYGGNVSCFRKYMLAAFGVVFQPRLLPPLRLFLGPGFHPLVTR